jgi:hypothetical protein
MVAAHERKRGFKPRILRLHHRPVTGGCQTKNADLTQLAVQPRLAPPSLRLGGRALVFPGVFPPQGELAPAGLAVQARMMRGLSESVLARSGNYPASASALGRRSGWAAHMNGPVGFRPLPGKGNA